MFTSRLTLLYAITIGLALISAIPISVNMKYHAKNFSFVDSTEFLRINPKPFKIIVVKNLANLRVLASDSLKLEIAKSWFPNTKVMNTGDTLKIVNSNAMDSSSIILFLPKGGVIFADHSALSLRGSFRRESPSDFSIDLTASKLSVPKYAYHLFINKLTVSSHDSSQLIISEFNQITDLTLSNLLIAKIASGTVWRYKTSFTQKKNVELNFDGDNFHITAKE